VHTSSLGGCRSKRERRLLDYAFCKPEAGLVPVYAQLQRHRSQLASFRSDRLYGPWTLPHPSRLVGCTKDVKFLLLLLSFAQSFKRSETMVHLTAHCLGSPRVQLPLTFDHMTMHDCACMPKLMHRFRLLLIFGTMLFAPAYAYGLFPREVQCHVHYNEPQAAANGELYVDVLLQRTLASHNLCGCNSSPCSASAFITHLDD